jgi:hypothetical protein
MLSYSRDHWVTVLERLVSYQLRYGKMVPQFLSATAQVYNKVGTS